MSDDLFSTAEPIDLSSILAIYEGQRWQMPKAQKRAIDSAHRYDNLRMIMDDFDALLLDGYGVLNVGGEVVPTARAMLDMAKARGVAVMVATNGGSKSSQATAEKYQNLGLDIEASQVVSSRDAMLKGLMAKDDPHLRIGVADAFAESPVLEQGRVLRLTSTDSTLWDEADIIAIFGAVEWDMAWQNQLQEALGQGKIVYVANPDVAAPQSPNRYSREPGFWVAKACHDLTPKRTPEQIAQQVHWFGKPHGAIFDLALERLKAYTGQASLTRDRIAMVGDSLHTDILGGQAAGLKTVLMTGHGFFSGGGAREAMAATGLVPDYVVDTL